MTAVIRTERLTKAYGEHRGIIELDLEVAEGEIFGFLGPNGAGKTTTMRVLLDLIRPTSGRAEVFGIETTVDPVAIHRRIGYLPGEFDLYDRLSGAETIDYFGNLRGGVDRAYVASLVERLDLDPSRRFKEYSKGNKQKVGLIVALQQRPDLLILDEPTAGLDPLIQQAFYELVREAREAGRTIFLSSHIIDEVDRTCDRVAIIREGRLVQVDTIEAIRELAFHHVELTFRAPVAPVIFDGLPGVGDVSAHGDVVTMRVNGPIGAVITAAAQHGLVDVVSREPNLEDVFLAQYGGQPVEGEAGRDGGGRPMTAEASVLTRPGRWARVAGLGSVYGKTVRDSRRAALVFGGVAALFMFGTGAPYGFAPEFSTVELRQAFVAGITRCRSSCAGSSASRSTSRFMGGFLSWRVGNFLPAMLGLWPVIALSGTLAGEAAKGSLDLLVSTPQGRRAVALQKLAGHVTAVIGAMLILAVGIWVVGAAFGHLPGDEIPMTAALGQVVMYGLMMLAVGGVAFATAPFVGRTRAAAFGLIALFGSYLLYSYASLSPLIETLSRLSFFSWTAGHRPMAGVTDWPAIAALAAVDLVLFAVGIWAFSRRDLGSFANVGWLRLPSLPAGTRGPFSRQLSDRAGIAIAWGLGIGLYGMVIVASATAFSAMIKDLPQIGAIIEAIYPGLDLTQPSAVLQLTFFAFGSFIMGLAGATFLAGWASDEGRRRLEMVLSTRRSRASWAIWSSLGVLAAIGLMTAVIGILTGVAVATQGGDVVGPVAGCAVLGLASAAFASVGLAAGGLVRTSLAAGVTAFLVIGTILIDTLGAALKLPGWVLDLSLYRHLGQPMAGTYDPVGIVAAAIVVVGGVAACAFGLTRRDIGR